MKQFNIILIAVKVNGDEIKAGCFDYEAPGGNEAAIIHAKRTLVSMGGAVVKSFQCYETGARDQAGTYKVSNGSTATILSKLNKVTESWEWKYS